ncbi:MAG: hypothetical protein WBP45_09575 [Daejeonella sp.]
MKIQELIIRLSVIFCIISLLITLIEIVAVHLFTPFFFRTGIRVFKQSVNIQTANLPIPHNQTIKKTKGKFQFSKDHKVYFVPKLLGPEVFGTSISFVFFKAMGAITNNQIHIVVRSPIGPVLYLLFMIIIAFASCIGLSGLGIILTIGISIFIIGLMVLISYSTGKERMEILIKELQAIIAEHSNNITNSTQTLININNI